MLSVNNLSKQFGPQILFEDINFSLSQSEKVGLVGRNGSGKTTLLKIILGKIAYDGGQIQFPRNYKLGHLEQHISFTKKTVLLECAQFLPEEEKEYSLYKIEKILMGLGFSKDDFQRDPYYFSGGQQIRINLAKVLGQNPNMLLLDEPTNYLDIVSIEWLKNFLRGFKGELMLITHDRNFMDSVVTHVMGLHRKQIKKIKGDTDNYYSKILEEESQYEKTRINQDKKRVELENFVRRFKAKASKAAQAQSRMKQLEKMGQMKELRIEKNLQFEFTYKACPGKILLTADHLKFSYPGSVGPPLIDKFSLIIKAQDRIAIIGKNGKGKSTLMNLISRDFRLDAGEISAHPETKIAFFAQTNISKLDNDKTIIEEIYESNPELQFQKVRNICGTMMFEGEMANKKIAVLSGGERARVMLGKILATPSNLLLLDEPTNHLDMESIQSLANEINDYKGALVVVTHNVELINAFAKRLIIFTESGIIDFDGTYEDFINKGGFEFLEERPLLQPFPLKKMATIKENLLEKNKKLESQSLIAKQIKNLESRIIEIEELTQKIDQKLLDAYRDNNSNDISDFLPLSGKLKNKTNELYQELELLFIQEKEILE